MEIYCSVCKVSPITISCSHFIPTGALRGMEKWVHEWAGMMEVHAIYSLQLASLGKMCLYSLAESTGHALPVGLLDLGLCHIIFLLHWVLIKALACLSP
jgi:hypothetical protein